MARGNQARRTKPKKRLKGMEKAMAQAGVEWDRKEAAKIRADESQRSSLRSSPGEPITPNSDGITTTDWLPLPALLGLSIAGAGGYFVAESTMAASAHPVHWIGAVVAGVAGYFGGFVWNRLRGF